MNNITEIEFEDMLNSLEMGLYEVLETDCEDTSIKVFFEAGKVTTVLEDDETLASNRIDLEVFQEFDFEALNKYFNNVWFYCGIPKEEN